MKVLTIGAAVVDIVVARALPMRGAKQDVEHIGLYAGGGAVNAGLNFAARGARVAVHAAVGRDLEGSLIADLLARQGLRAAFDALDEPTGKAVVIVDEQGAARAYAQRGASARVGEGGFPGLGDCELVYVTGLSLKSQECLQAALARLPRRGFRLAVTPGARQLSRPDGLAALRCAADLLCMNAHEAARLCGEDPPEDVDGRGIAPERAEALARRVVVREGQGALVTLGASGAVFYDGQAAHFGAPHRVDVVSTVGAGDAYASAFAHEWARGASPSRALSEAAASAAEVIGTLPANLAGALRR
ncbi:carbohydrate kinase family protein [Castellaniella sp. GW247-6E4]|uniref:carbohydrate kinase family protein n=1 Tax=Castellaniella sp. GW247-6E4 TaxID=3140380 RepID=UPI003315EB8B